MSRPWHQIWPLVEHCLSHSTSLPEAAARVTEMRGTYTSWEAIAKAWRRRGDVEGAACDLIGTKCSPAHRASGLVERLEQDVERYREGLVAIWQYAYETHNRRLQRMVDTVLDGEQ